MTETSQQSYLHVTSDLPTPSTFAPVHKLYVDNSVSFIQTAALSILRTIHDLTNQTITFAKDISRTSTLVSAFLIVFVLCNVALQIDTIFRTVHIISLIY